MKFFDTKLTNPEFEAEIEDQLGKKILKTTYMADRLTGISMMGLVYMFENVPEQYVYNRYDHTIAVAHLTLRLCRNLSIPKVETKLAVLAALCHDLGHGPLSHSSEGYLHWKSGTQSGHQKSNHFTKIAAMLQEYADELPSDLTDSFENLESLAKAAYYVTQGAMPQHWKEKGVHLLEGIYTMFDAPFSADVIDGDNRAFLSLSHKSRLGLSPADPEAIIDAISSHQELFVVDGIYGKSLIKKFANLQGRFYSNVIQTKKLEAGEAMLARAIELVYKSRKTSIGFSNLTDANIIGRFTREPGSKSARLWHDLESIQLFTPLSEQDPDLYKLISTTYPIQKMSLQTFKDSKAELERRLAQKLGLDEDLVIAQVLQPLQWDEDNVDFVPKGLVTRKTASRYKVIWAEAQGMPQAKRLEIYIPAY